MKRIEKLAIFIRSWEGGYTNIPQDSGGPTNKGVTLATFRSVYGKDKTVSDLKNITLEQWEHIFKRYFWDRWKADNIKDEWVSYLLVDWIWGSGKYGITKVQQYLRIPADGIVGQKTWDKLGVSYNPRNIKEIIVHCSATPEGKDFTTAQIKQWHLDKYQSQ